MASCGPARMRARLASAREFAQPGPLVGLPLRPHGEPGGADRQQEHQPEHAEQPAEGTGAAGLHLGSPLLLGGQLARLGQLPLLCHLPLPPVVLDRRPAGLRQRRQTRIEADLGGVRAGQPALRLQQLHLVEQPAGAAAEPDPLGRLGLQPAPGLLGGTPFADPGLEVGPAGDEGLVGEVDHGRPVPLLAGRGQQPALGEVVERPLEVAGLVGAAAERGDRLLAADVVPALAELHQPEQDAPCGGLLGRRQLGHGGVGTPGQGDLEAAAARRAAVGTAGHRHQALVGGERQQPPLQPLPQQHQGLLDEREHTRLAGGVRDQPLHERCLHEHVEVLGGSHDRLAERVAVERQHLHPVCLDEGPERRRHQLRVEVGSSGHHHPAAWQLGEAEEQLLEPLRARLGDREQLLELIDDQQQLGVLAVL